MVTTVDPLLRELVGAMLRQERRRQRRTLAQVAEAAGVSMQHLSDVERGRKDPSSELLGAVTGALGLGVQDLLRRIVETSAAHGAAPPSPVLLDLTARSRDSLSSPAGWAGSDRPLGEPARARSTGGRVTLLSAA